MLLNTKKKKILKPCKKGVHNKLFDFIRGPTQYSNNVVRVPTSISSYCTYYSQTSVAIWDNLLNTHSNLLTTFCTSVLNCMYPLVRWLVSSKLIPELSKFVSSFLMISYTWQIKINIRYKIPLCAEANYLTCRLHKLSKKKIIIVKWLTSSGILAGPAPKLWIFGMILIEQVYFYTSNFLSYQTALSRRSRAVRLLKLNRWVIALPLLCARRPVYWAHERHSFVCKTLRSSRIFAGVTRNIAPSVIKFFGTNA